MAINTLSWDKAIFDDKLKLLLAQLEDNRPDPYYDTPTARIPTIGIGFNLRDPGVRSIVFAAMGITDSNTQAALLGVISDTSIYDTSKTKDQNSAVLRQKLNAKYGGSFQMDPSQIDAAFKQIIGSYVTKAKDKNNIGYSKELIVLVSLQYNGMYGTGLQAALNLSDPYAARAEAWYQIRYAHVAGQNDKRRHEEAAIFGLYEDPANVTSEEAMAVYQMFTAHRIDMINYDTSYTTQSCINEANADLVAAGFTEQVAKLSDELKSAANILMAEYGHGRTNFNPLNIQVASDDKYNLTGENTMATTGSNDDLLIGHATEGSWLDGGDGKEEKPL